MVSDTPANKLRVLVHAVDSFTGVDLDLAQMLLETLRGTQGLPSYEMLIEAHDFPYTVPTPDRALSSADAWSIIDLESNNRRVRELGMNLLEAGRDLLAGEKTEEEIRVGLTEVLDTTYGGCEELEELDIAKIIEERRKASSGIYTFVEEFDDIIRGIEFGTVATLMGFVGALKTTFGINFLHGNVTKCGYNGVFITLEMPKKILFSHLISRHSFVDRFRGNGGPINKEKVQKPHLLDAEEEKFVKEVQKDLKENPEHGKFQFMELSDFRTFDKAGIRSRLMGLPFIPDFIIFDYIQLTKYTDFAARFKNFDPINYFVRALAEICQDFNGKKMAVLLLSQANREGWKRAVEADGCYDLAALSEANELERTSSYVLTSFIDDDLRVSRESKMQLLKHRMGDILPTPVLVSYEPEYAALGTATQVDTGHTFNIIDSTISNLSFSNQYGGNI